MIKLAGNNTEFFKIENKRWILTSLFFGTLLLLPILIIFFKIFQDKGDSFKYLWENLLIEYSLNTLYLVLITSIYSLITFGSGIKQVYLLRNIEVVLVVIALTFGGSLIGSV